MPQILHVFLLPTDDIFRRHSAWLAACAQIDLPPLAIAERAIDPFLRAIRRLGVTTFTQAAMAYTDPVAFVLQHSELYYEPLPADLENEFLVVWREILMVFLQHATHLYQQVALEHPRLVVKRLVGGDVEIALLSESSAAQYL